MYILLSSLVRMLAPILSFTADEAWLSMSHAADDDARNVMLNDMPVYDEAYAFTEIADRWDRLFALRDDVMKALEQARANKMIGKSLDAKITLTVADKEKFELLTSFGTELETVFIVSGVTVILGDADKVEVAPADGCKCVRCWKYADKGMTDEQGFLCERCKTILGLCLSSRGREVSPFQDLLGTLLDGSSPMTGWRSLGDYYFPMASCSCLFLGWGGG